MYNKNQKLDVWILGEDDIPAFLELQDKALKSLPDEKKHFLKVRSAEDLKDHLDARMPMIGIKNAQGQLLAQCLIAYPYREEAKNIGDYPDQVKTVTNAIIQSVCVDPAMRGLKLSEQILDAAKDLAAQNGHVALVAKVADDNLSSRNTFAKNDFTPAATATVPYAATFYTNNLLGTHCSAASDDMAYTPKVA